MNQLGGSILSICCLFCIILGISATLSRKNWRRELKNKFVVVTAFTMLSLIMPALAIVSVKVFHHQLTQAMGIRVLLVKANPVGSCPNWQPSNTTTADLSLLVADGPSVVDASDYTTIVVVFLMVVTAIVTGLTAVSLYDVSSFHATCNGAYSVTGILLILFGLFLSSSAHNSEGPWWNQDCAIFVAALFPCLTGLAVSHVIARSMKRSHPETLSLCPLGTVKQSYPETANPSHHETLTVAIECCYDNTTIASSVAITMLPAAQDQAMEVAVPLLYSIVKAVVVGKAGCVNASADDRSCAGMIKTTEVAEDSRKDRVSDYFEKLERDVEVDSVPCVGIFERLFCWMNRLPARRMTRQRQNALMPEVSWHDSTLASYSTRGHRNRGKLVDYIPHIPRPAPTGPPKLRFRTAAP
jgi:hypothetical protein